jgi:tetratricopeptide (TPR) repeat protein
MKRRLLVISILLLASLVVYYQLGAWHALATQRWIKRTEQELSLLAQKQTDPKQLIAWLHQRAETMPEAPEIRSLMAEYALLLQDYPQALAWSEQALQQSPDNPYAMLQYLQIAFPAQGGKFTPDTRAILQQLAILEPEHPSVLNFLAIDAFAEGRYEVAKRIWQQLLQQLPADSDILPTLYKALQEVDLRLLKAAPTQKRIHLHLQNVPALKHRHLGTDYVFISVRQKTVNMPIWVKKIRLSELTDKVVLSSADAMTAGDALETAKEITVSVKITPSADPLKPAATTETFVSQLVDASIRDINVTLDLN